VYQDMLFLNQDAHILQLISKLVFAPIFTLHMLIVHFLSSVFSFSVLSIHNRVICTGSQWV